MNEKRPKFVHRQVVQDFGPFPIIGCDSESLCWLFNDGDVAENFARDDSGEVLGEVALVLKFLWLA